MPVLTNPRHEAFAQERAKGKTATDAYALAGFKPHDGNAARLSGKERIIARVAEIQSKGAKRAEITVQSLADELEEARAIALKEGQTSAAVSATMGKAKLFGLGVENKRVSGTFQVVNLTHEQIGKLSADERAALASALPVLEKLGAFAEDVEDG